MTQHGSQGRLDGHPTGHVVGTELALQQKLRDDLVEGNELRFDVLPGQTGVLQKVQDQDVHALARLAHAFEQLDASSSSTLPRKSPSTSSTRAVIARTGARRSCATE